MFAPANESSTRPLALVTGASSGIGAALARELARSGHDLVLVARRKALLQAMVGELSEYRVNVTVIAANLGTFGAASRLMAEMERLGLNRVDVLVNNAGFGDYADFARAEATKLAEMIQLNVVTLTELTRLFLPGMLAQKSGQILLVAGIAGFAPGPGAAVFHATKAYVISLGEALHHELRRTEVRVTTVCPGPTQTGFLAAAGGGREHARPLSFWGVMTPDSVARQARTALALGQCILLPGLVNKLRAILLRLAPRRWSLTLASGGSGAR